MKRSKNIFTLIAFFVIFDCYAQKSELKPYIDFLQQQNTSPVDYVFKLFEDHDIVILCERDHRDISQYELIKDILYDPRFVDKVGHIFTEVGVHNQTERANQILSGKYEDYLAFEKDLMGLYRNIDYEMAWEKYNYWDLLSTIYNINTRLDESRKLTIHLTDVEFDWDHYFDIDSYLEKYVRDSIIGHNFIYEYDRILQNDKEPRKKALVILNSYHSFKDHPMTTWGKSAASFIFNKYSDRVVNVMMNCMNFSEVTDTPECLLDHGKWDAAFKCLDNPEFGFDMANSPFGEVILKYYDSIPVAPLKDIFTGFIFYKPMPEWILMFGIPGFVDEEFKAEYIRRKKLKTPNIQIDQITRAIPYYNILKIRNFYEGNDLDRKQVDEWINYWLK